MLRAFILLMVVSMSSAGLEALSLITGIKATEGTYQYRDGPRDVIIRASGIDQFGTPCKIIGWWLGGYPQIFYIVSKDTL